MPRISVVIPHVDSYPRFSACLESVLRERPGDGVEVLTVGDGASEPTYRFLEPKAVRALRCPERRGAGCARNRGAREAKGEFLVFIDSDVEVGSGFFAALSGRLDALPPRTILQGVYGERIPYEDGPSQYKNLYYRYNFFRRVRTTAIRSLSSHCFAMRREDFQALAGFDERMPGATVEDAELGMRAVERGFRIELAPELEVIHHKRYSLWSLLVTDFQLCRNKLKVWLRRPRAVAGQPRLIAVSGVGIERMAAVVLSVALAPAALLAAPAAPRAAAALAALVAALNVPFYLFVARLAGAARALQAVPIGFLDYCAAFAGSCAGLVEFLLGRRY